MKVSKMNEPHYVWGENCDGWRLADEPDRSVIHERMPPGTSETEHYHVRAKQLFFMLSGQAAMYIKGERTLLNAHEGIAIEPGVPHRMTNESAEPTEFLVISTPTTKGDRIEVR
ncbi:cupin [Gordoniibacillus kamchatkensis]|uniref:Cupin n=1 Tax=Gordoniibacillus kamchatkensis TaxID=1590651 RepID=A0ABR5AEX2_9BACL|nr:cupin domain-containing protein [Paenibacillus sp. VKM B-2647]KIL39613.1 cupin [Paenibacillus sp. VKM B-2647]